MTDDKEIVELSRGTEVLRIDNATDADTGAYACVVGNARANFMAEAYLSVKDTPVPAWPVDGSASVVAAGGFGGRALAGVLFCVVFVFLLVLVACVYRRYRRERFKKEQALANMQSITQWTKKVS